MIFELAQDFQAALMAMPREYPKRCAIEPLAKSIMMELRSISIRPYLAASLIFNGFRWLAEDCEEVEVIQESAEKYLDKKGLWISVTAPITREDSTGSVAVSYSFDAPLQALSGDGAVLAVACPKGDSEIWNLRRNERIANQRLGSMPIKGIALSPNGHHLAYIGTDNIVRILDGENQIGYRDGERLLEFLSDSELLIVDADGNLLIWNSITGQSFIIARSIQRPLLTNRARDNGRKALLIAGEEDQTILLLDQRMNKWACRRLPHAGAPASQADLSEDGEKVALVCRDRRIQVIDAANGKVITENFYERHESVHAVGPIFKCIFGRGADRDYIYFITWHGLMLRWSFPRGELEQLTNCWTPTELARPCLFEYLPDLGQPFISTVYKGMSLDTGRRRETIPRHEARVNCCFVTQDGVVASLSMNDQTVRWFAADGGNPMHDVQYIRYPSTMAQSRESHDALMGNCDGLIWRLPPNTQPPQESSKQVFNEPVQSLLDQGDGGVIVAAKSGTIKRVLSDDSAEILRQSIGMSQQIKLCAAGRYGICWDLRIENTIQGPQSVVSLIKEGGREEEIDKAFYWAKDIAVTRNGERICIGGKNVRILEHARGKWRSIYHRDTAVEYTAFVGEGDLLAVVLTEAPWLEIWHIEDGLPTITAIHISKEISCLNACGDRIVAGCVSGNILCLRIHLES